MSSGNRRESVDEPIPLRDGQGLSQNTEDRILGGENTIDEPNQILREDAGDGLFPTIRTRPARGTRRVRNNDGVRREKKPDYKRQVSIFNPEDFKNITVTIAGAGNIGSHTALALARMGLSNFHLYDFDSIEEHNLSSQAYTVGDVGKPKIDALAGQMRELNPDVRIRSHFEPFTGKEQEGQILVSAVDSMKARREICANMPGDTFVFDGRMGGGQMEVHSQLAKEWGATLEQDGDEDPCGARFISYTSYIIAGLISNNVKRYLLKQRMAKRILFHVDTLELITVF